MAAAYEEGVNFFDNAEGYAAGNAEIVMGNAIKKLGWRRESIVVSTKIFWGGQGPNDTGLSHKHIIEGVNNALRRLQMDYVDLVFCHRPDPNTPIEETVRAMDVVIKQGKAFYWGTSEWSAAEILRADGIARQYGLTPPTMEQPQYNMLARERFEMEYAPVLPRPGLRHHHLEPAGLRPADRQVQRRRARRQPSLAARNGLAQAERAKRSSASPGSGSCSR